MIIFIYIYLFIIIIIYRFSDSNKNLISAQNPYIINTLEYIREHLLNKRSRRPIDSQ